MQSIIIVIFAVCCYVVPYAIAKQQDTLPSIETSSSIVDQSAVQTTNNEEHSDATLNRQKRTLLLKKKLIAGAGLLGFGLGAIKG